MVVKLEGSAPYAPSTAVIEFLTRHRNGALPAPVTAQTLERLGISQSLRPRTLQALKLLDFITEDGEFTPEMDNLRRVPTPEYGPKLAEVFRLAYADVFAIVDPATATYEQVSDAFRGFTPAGQMGRMVALFLALLTYTGQWTELPTPRGPAPTGKPAGPRKATASARKVSGPRTSDAPKPPAAPNEKQSEPPAPPTAPQTGEYAYSIELPDGAGTVTLSATVNPMKLRGPVRAFFYGLVDAMSDYEQTTSGSAS